MKYYGNSFNFVQALIKSYQKLSVILIRFGCSSAGKLINFLVDILPQYFFYRFKTI